MVIQYKVTGKKAEITACYGNTTTVILPEEIDGIPVVRAAAYAFSAAKEEEKGEVLWRRELPEENPEELPRICGQMLEEIVFPDSVESIGNYIFYGCKNLRKIELTDRLLQIGSGAFTGCLSLSEIVMHLNHGEKSCLKEITDEIRKELRVTMHYMAEDESGKEKGRQTAKLIFPEHYEEAVENTPARLLVTKHHGSGGYYRQCFYDKKVDYRKYDELFQTSAALDSMELVLDILFGRLFHPYGLWSSAKEAYMQYLKEHAKEAARLLASADDLKRLKFLGEADLYTEEVLDAAIDESSKLSNPESLGYLMNERHKRYPVKKKVFEL